MSDLGVLFPQSERIELDGSAIEVRAVEMRHFALFGSVANSLLQVLTCGSVDKIHDFGVTQSGSLISAVRATTNISWWRARRLPASVLMQVMLQAIKVNSGFFAQAQSAALQALVGLQSPSD